MVHQRINRFSTPDLPAERVSRFAPRPFALRRALAVSTPPGPGRVIRRVEYPKKWDRSETDGLTTFTGLREDESEEQREDRVYEDLTALTPFSGGVEYNCFAWALGLTAFENPGSALGTWEYRLGDDYEFVEPADAADAPILLWGTEDPRGRAKFEVNHASVLLTHEELLARKSHPYSDLDIDEASIANLPDPFWSSAMGAGFGVAVHPRDFFEGGDFGTLIAGMKKK